MKTIDETIKENLQPLFDDFVRDVDIEYHYKQVIKEIVRQELLNLIDRVEYMVDTHYRFYTTDLMDFSTLKVEIQNEQ